MTSLLPHNSTPLERALEAATARDMAVPVGDLWSPERCPAAQLPWLAWALSVDMWDADWPEAVKRRVIAKSIAVHRKKGTRWAVAQMLDVIGIQVEISEWWQYGGAPHTFRLDGYVDDILSSGRRIDDRLHREVSMAIGHVKPARSHFDLRLGETFRATQPLRVGTRAQSRQSADSDPAPAPYALPLTAPLRAGCRARTVQSGELTPSAAPTASAAALTIRNTSRASARLSVTHDVQRRAA